MLTLGDCFIYIDWFISSLRKKNFAMKLESASLSSFHHHHHYHTIIRTETALIRVLVLKQHSTETALIRVFNDILVALDNHQEVVMVLLDLSAAFDTIDYSALFITPAMPLWDKWDSA